MPIPPPNERPTAQQLAAQSGVEPWVCPRCGCRDWRVVDSRYVTDDPRFIGFAKRRVRVCRNCKTPLPTSATTLEIAVPDGHKVNIVPDSELGLLRIA